MMFMRKKTSTRSDQNKHFSQNNPNYHASPNIVSKQLNNQVKVTLNICINKSQDVS